MPNTASGAASSKKLNPKDHRPNWSSSSAPQKYTLRPNPTKRCTTVNDSMNSRPVASESPEVFELVDRSVIRYFECRSGSFNRRASGPRVGVAHFVTDVGPLAALNRPHPRGPLGLRLNE